MVALASALEHLLEKYPYDDITVSALCNEALVRRSTFYKHYADKDEFLQSYFRGLQQAFERKAAIHGEEELADYMPRMNAELFEFLEANRAVAHGILGSAQAPLLVQSVVDMIARNARLRLEESGQAQGLQAEVFSRFLAGGIACVVQEEWLAADADPARRRRIETTLYEIERAALSALRAG